MFKNFLSNTINKIRPPEPKAVVFEEKGKELPVQVVPNRSPRWQNSTKQFVVIGLFVILAISIYFLRNMIAPIIFSLILTYLILPIASYIHRKFRFSWTVSVVVIYLIMILIILGITTWGGFAIFSQAENLINFLIESINDFPKLMEKFLKPVNGNSDPLKTNLWILLDTKIGVQLSDNIQGILKNAAGGIASFAQGALSKIGWLFFIIGFSFFIVLESRHFGKSEITFSTKGYEFDILMAKQQISRIWNSFLRGQVILMIFAILLYTLLFSILGLNYSFILALGVGAARLIPYVGSTVAFTAYGIVAYFQEPAIFGLSPLAYAIMIVGIAFIIDKIIDGLLTPKIMADTLKIHPAMILIFAIIFSRIFGIIGFFLAAPMFASLKLVVNYILHKLSDSDPWENIETITPPVPLKELIDTSIEKLKSSLKKIWTFCSENWKLIKNMKMDQCIDRKIFKNKILMKKSQETKDEEKIK